MLGPEASVLVPPLGMKPKEAQNPGQGGGWWGDAPELGGNPAEQQQLNNSAG